ncbi:MAG: TlpA disulfide reductase family protein [Bacteroidetes bacterium]|nr:TlpA disulfide reductase family protein [Bacteroidota bacterium]MDA1335770.1 TlpA disulfide reductase family protein [Bacteroidota bacterium]
MKMISAATILMTFFAFSACSSGEKVESASNPTESGMTQQVEEGANGTNAQVSSRYKDGINDQNRGDKVGPVRLHGTINFNGGGEVTLYETEGRNTSEIAKTTLSNRAFDFGELEVGRGFYKISLNGETNAADIILNPDEPDVELTFNTSRLSAGKTAVGSNENTGWFQYQSFEFENNKAIRELRGSIKDAGAFRARIEEQIREKEGELVTQQHQLMDQYPGTFLAKYLGWKNPKFPQDKGRFFEDMDPMDNSAVRSMAISDRIQNMMRTFSEGTDPGFLACIDLVKAHFEPNPIALESVLYTMLDGFYNTGKETICQYILDNYIFDEDCGADLSDAIRLRAQGIINLQVGKTPPNFQIDKWDGGVLDLYETCKAKEYTLVMFWASWCHKCEQEIPNLGPLYAKYGYKGFEIVGVSIDQVRNTWEKAINDNGMTWPNVSQLQAWNSPVVAEYKITATPTYFLLDKEGKIVLKPKRYFEVEKFLSENLK